VNIWWIPLLLGCVSPKLLKVENQLLQKENTELRDKLASCDVQRAPSDYLTQVDMAGVQRFITRAGFENVKLASDTVLTIPIQGRNTSFMVNVQLFEREKVLFMATAGYLDLEIATSSQAMVLLLTQLVAINYELLVGKFQLNPNSGAITLSAEIQLDDGLGYQTLLSTINHLIQTADDQHPSLVSAARGMGL
jgi:hypothetical protein